LWKAGSVAYKAEPRLDVVLAEQMAYYAAVAAEYDSHSLPAPGGDELVHAIEAFQPEGRVLELACGRGRWTGELLRFASEVTAVDAAPEMLAIAAEHLGSCSPTYQTSGSAPFGRSWLRAWCPVGESCS
jgi:SAM-dependent methyltransferase